MAYRIAVRASYDVALRIPGEAGLAGRTHGHRYTVEAVLAANALDGQGFVADFDRAQAALSAIAAELDHRFLNEVKAFEGAAPSAERQAEYFYRRLSEALRAEYGGIRLIRVKVVQEPDAWAEYEP